MPFHDRDEESLETLRLWPEIPAFSRVGNRFAWRRFSPGPLQPLTAPGKALKWFWQRAPQAGEQKKKGPDHHATLELPRGFRIILQV